MARLDQVITNIVDIFLEYADDEGKKRQLNKEELKKVLQQEIQSPELKVSSATHSGYTMHTIIYTKYARRLIGYILTSAFVHFLLII